MAIPGTKKAKKNNRTTEDIVTDRIRMQQILGEISELVSECKTSAALRKALNSASWKIKKAILMEALETGAVDKVDKIATEILGLTEAKKTHIDGNINVNENVQILLAEITDVPYAELEARARQLREGRQGRIGFDRSRDDEEGPEEVFLVQDGEIQG